jgi:hypothetical protein
VASGGGADARCGGAWRAVHPLRRAARAVSSVRAGGLVAGLRCSAVAAAVLVAAARAGWGMEHSENS